MIYLILLLLEIFLLYLLMRKTSNKIFNLLGTYFFAVLFLPGTFIHEMSHFLVALFLLVPVGQIELIPKIENDRIKMGSVSIGKTDPIRRTLIGIAPIVFGLTIILGSIFYIYKNNLFHFPIALIIISYIAFEVGNTMFSSKEDLRGIIPVFVIITIIYLLLYFLGLRISLDLNLEIIKMADLFLLVPIAIDSLVLLIFR